MAMQHRALTPACIAAAFIIMGPRVAYADGDSSTVGGFHFVIRSALSPAIYSPPVSGDLPGIEPTDFVFAPLSLGLGIELELGARATPTVAFTGVALADISLVPTTFGDDPPSETVVFDMGFAGGLRARIGPKDSRQYWFVDGGGQFRAYQGGTDDDINGFFGQFIGTLYPGGWLGGGFGWPRSWGETRLRATVGALAGEDTLVFPVTLELHVGWGGG